MDVNNADPYDQQSDPGEVWVHEGSHLMIALRKPMLQGITNDPNRGGPYVMWGDALYARIMVPTASGGSQQ